MERKKPRECLSQKRIILLRVFFCIVFSIVKYKEYVTSYHTTIILLCETTFVDVADDSFFLGTFDGFCFTFKWKK